MTYSHRRIRRLILTLVVCCSAGVSVAWIARGSDEVAEASEGYDFTFPVMGSSMTFSAYGISEAQISTAFEDAKREVERLAAIMTDYDPNSELSRLSQMAGAWTKPSEEMWEVLTRADDWHRLSNGGFDIAIGNLTRLWRNGRREGVLPKRDEVEAALLHSGWSHVEIDHASHRLRLNDNELKLDLGGIATGYIVDRAYAVLQSHGLKSCLVNSGGDIRCGEAPPRREGWKIEIASLRKGGPPARRIYLANTAVTTSGDLWQSSLVDGVRRSHILDARTGYGVRGPLSVTLLAPTCIDADAGATALCVIGKEKAFQFVEKKSGYKLLWIELDASGSLAMQASKGFPSPIE